MERCNRPGRSCTLLGVEGEERGSRDAVFSELVYSRWPRLVRLAYGFIGDVGLAEDLAQTALSNAYASWSRLQRADDPDRYLIRILINTYRSGFRKRRPAESLSGTWSVGQAGELAVDPTHAVDDRGAIMAALAGLPAGQREVIVLRYWLDLTEVQVAALLDCTVGNVKSQTSRALAKLRLSPELQEWGSR
jgi:RNA polymerase sigma-70 factor (sigma-E family)